jgi:formate hydrogenlyase subunit 4
MTDIKEGYFVQFSGRLCPIIEIADGLAKLCNGQKVASYLLCPVVADTFLDIKFTQVCDYLRFSVRGCEN